MEADSALTSWERRKKAGRERGLWGLLLTLSVLILSSPLQQPHEVKGLLGPQAGEAPSYSNWVCKCT